VTAPDMGDVTPVCTCTKADPCPCPGARPAGDCHCYTRQEIEGDVTRLVNADDAPEVDDQVRVAAAAIMARPTSVYHCWFPPSEREAVEFAKAAVSGLKAAGYALVRLSDLPDPDGVEDDGTHYWDSGIELPQVLAYEIDGVPHVELSETAYSVTESEQIRARLEAAERKAVSLADAAHLARAEASAPEGCGQL